MPRSQKKKAVPRKQKHQKIRPASQGKDPKKQAAGRKGGLAAQAPGAEVIKAQRMKRIMELRRKGRTFVEIGQELDLDAAGCWRLWDEALDMAHGEIEKAAVRERKRQMIEQERMEAKAVELLDLETLKVGEKRADGSMVELREFDALNRLILTVLKIHERKAKVVGADAPTQLEVNGPKPLTQGELMERLAQLRAERGA